MLGDGIYIGPTNDASHNTESIGALGCHPNIKLLYTAIKGMRLVHVPLVGAWAIHWE